MNVVSGVYQAMLEPADGPLPASGMTLTLRGFSDAGAILNDIAFRFVGPPGRLFDLMWDTATELGPNNPFQIQITADPSPTDTVIVCRRPLCVQIDSAANPDVLNNSNITVPVEVRRVRDGKIVTNLRLAQIAPGSKRFLIVTPAVFPSPLAVAVDGDCVVVATQAASYLEAAVRTKAILRPDLNQAWRPGLMLTEPSDLTELRNRLVGAGLIRLGDAKAPQANGIFGMFHRPAVGNNSAGSGGQVVSDLDSNPINLNNVDGTRIPIIIELANPPDPAKAWKEWTTRITVSGVSAVPMANGTWIVQKNDDTHYALYEPAKVDVARTSVGNGLIAASEGEADSFLDSELIPLARVDGENTPITIELTAAPDDPWNDGTPVAVRGVTSVPQANGTWIVRRMDATHYALYEPTSVDKDAAAAAEVPAVVSAVIPLDEAFQQVDLEPRLACLHPDFDPHWQPLDRPLLQVHWAGAGQFPGADGKGIAWRQGGVSAGLYEQAKQVKFLANSQLSPKLAFVLTAPTTPVLQRTILFGDAAPPFKATPALETDADGKLFFRLEVRDNREELTVAVPTPTAGDFVLHLVKSLPSGVAVYDRCEKTPGIYTSRGHE